MLVTRAYSTYPQPFGGQSTCIVLNYYIIGATYARGWA